MNEPNEPKDYWSEEIFYHYGVGYGLTRLLQTVVVKEARDTNRDHAERPPQRRRDV